MILTHLYDTNVGHGLKPLISALSKLPYTPDEIAGILKDLYQGVLVDRKSKDFALFSLVLADQFHRKGFDAPAVYEEALALLEYALSDKHLASIKNGPDKPLYRPHCKTLGTLRERLHSPLEEKKRTIRKSPQALIFQLGDVICFPVFGTRKRSKSPYSASSDEGPPTGWKVALIINSPLIFGYLACYRPLVCQSILTEIPDLGDVLSLKTWHIGSPGTCSPTHVKRLGIEVIGHVDLMKNLDAIVDRLPLDDAVKNSGDTALLKLSKDGVHAAASSVSISNFLNPVAEPDSLVRSLEELRITSL